MSKNLNYFYHLETVNVIIDTMFISDEPRLQVELYHIPKVNIVTPKILFLLFMLCKKYW